jgi:hypothetical protein
MLGAGEPPQAGPELQLPGAEIEVTPAALDGPGVVGARGLEAAEWAAQPAAAECHGDHHTGGGELGEFKWLSQHMTSEVLRWESPSVDDQIEPDVRKCALRADRQAGSASTSSASGERSPRDLRARMLAGQREWRQRWGADGSAKLAGCEHFLQRRSPVATCDRQTKRGPPEGVTTAQKGTTLITHRPGYGARCSRQHQPGRRHDQGG